MNLSELKRKSAEEIVAIAKANEIEDIARSRTQDIIFNILKKRAKIGEDIYVSPGKIRSFSLRAGDTVGAQSGRKTYFSCD